MKTATFWGLFAFAAMGLLVNQSFAQGQGNCLGQDCPEGAVFVKYEVNDSNMLVQTDGPEGACEFIITETKEDGEIMAFLVECEGYSIERMAAKTAECDEESFFEGDAGSWAAATKNALSHVEFCLNQECIPEETTVEIGDPFGPSGQKMIEVTYSNGNGITGLMFSVLDGTYVDETAANAAGCTMAGGNPMNWDCDGSQEITLKFNQSPGATGAVFMGVAKTECGDTDIDPALVFETPEAYNLLGNYPNPFNPSTTIQYQVPEATAVTLQVFDTLGRLVNTLYNGEAEAGTHSVEWDGTNSRGQAVGSGVYLYRLDAGAFTSTRSMLLFK